MLGQPRPFCHRALDNWKFGCRFAAPQPVFSSQYSKNGIHLPLLFVPKGRKGCPNGSTRSSAMISGNAVMTGSYDYGEVAGSILIAIAGSYAALDLAGRVTVASSPTRWRWLRGGAIAM